MANFRLDSLTLTASVLDDLGASFEVDTPIDPEMMRPVTEYQHPDVLRELHGRIFYRVDLLWRDPQQGSYKNVRVQVFTKPAAPIPSGARVRLTGDLYIAVRVDNGWPAYTLTADALELEDAAPASFAVPHLTGGEND